VNELEIFLLFYNWNYLISCVSKSQIPIAVIFVSIIQVNIVKNCRRLGIGEGGFYQPSFGGRRKMHLWMMCLGKDWDPESRLYGEIRYHDNTVPPRIPTEFVPLVYRAIHTAHDALRKNGKLKGADVEHVLPYMDPDVCIVNFYNETGRLGLHQVIINRFLNEMK
jgi:hypothetical protein